MAVRRIQAQVNPLAVAVDKQGNIYISTLDYHIRKVDATGMITTIAGTGIPAMRAIMGRRWTPPWGSAPALICDAKGDLYLADPDNGYVRMIDTSGIIHPVAGSGPIRLYHSILFPLLYARDVAEWPGAG